MTTTETPAPVQERDKKQVGPVTKCGNTAADFELAFSPKGVAYARGRIAVTSPVTPGDWNGEKKTDWYGVVCFGSLAENVVESCPKGTRLIVSGRGEIEQYVDGNGEMQLDRSIVADFIGPDLRWATAQVVKAKFEGPAKAKQLLPEPEEMPF